MSCYNRHRRKRKHHGNKKPKFTRMNKGVREPYDFHHFMFQKKHWVGGCAGEIRNHPYAGAFIPKATLHCNIHSKIHDVPRPNEDVCRETLDHLREGVASGRLDPKRDSPQQKLAFFINEWKDRCPATAEMLRWQLQVIDKFYGKEVGDVGDIRVDYRFRGGSGQAVDHRPAARKRDKQGRDRRQTIPDTNRQEIILQRAGVSQTVRLIVAISCEVE